MNCPKCNTSNPEGSNFCKACGYDLKPLKDTNKKTKIWGKTWFRVLAIVVAVIISPKFLLSLYIFYFILYLISRFLKSTQPLEFVIGAIKIMVIGLGCLLPYVMYLTSKDFFKKGDLLGGLTSIPTIFNILPLFLFIVLVGSFIFIGPGYLLLEDLEKRYNVKNKY